MPALPLANAAEFPLWVNAAIFLAAAAVVWLSGTRLTLYVDAIAERTAMGRAFAGMLLLGVITSLPEVANCITAATIGSPGLAVNNLLGSAAINILLLAVVDAAVGREAVTAVVAKPSTLMMAALNMLVLAAVALSIVVGDVAIAGIGIAASLLCLLSIGAFWLASGYAERSPWTVRKSISPRKREVRSEEKADDSLRNLFIKTTVAGAIIFTAGYALSQTGDAIAQQTGIGTGMVGFALIGTSTSMPELSTVYTALRMRRYELAFGQVLGTNFVNLSLILLTDAFFTGGPVINELGRFEVVSALLGLVLIGVFLVGLLERRNPKILKMGYDSLAVMILFAGGLMLLYFVQ
jgi:cation:H+ antiporter